VGTAEGRSRFSLSRAVYVWRVYISLGDEGPYQKREQINKQTVDVVVSEVDSGRPQWEGRKMALTPLFLAQPHNHTGIFRPRS